MLLLNNWLFLFLHFLGIVIASSVAFISVSGYKKTQSPTLLRLAISFCFISLSFFVDTIINLTSFGIIPIFALALSLLVIIASGLEATGYFFLAFSHIVNVRSSSKVGLLATFMIPKLNLSVILQSLSFFFVLFGAVETILSYFSNKNINTFFISMGLMAISLSVPLTWASSLYVMISPNFLLYALVTKVMGLSILFIPVIRFTRLWSSQSTIKLWTSSPLMGF